jgi:predicted nucleic acid-binding protein
VTGILVDTNVLVDVITRDPRWEAWSRDALDRAVERSMLVINPIVYAELSVGYRTIEDLHVVLPVDLYRREPLPFPAAFLAGKAFEAYRLRGGRRAAPLADFYIGAHAAVAGYQLLTRDAARYRTYFPRLALIAPESSEGPRFRRVADQIPPTASPRVE